MGYAVVLLGLVPFLPSDIPMQYSITGGVNYTLPKILAVFLMLALNIGLVVLFNVQSKNEDYPAKHLVTQGTLIVVTLILLVKNLF